LYDLRSQASRAAPPVQTATCNGLTPSGGLAALWRHPSAPEASRRLDLLARVRKHKARFFASSWANYPTAVPGSLRLVPPTARLAELRADYVAMHPMFLDAPLAFDEMLTVLREAEQTLNRA
jgi:hypothetical protein